MCYRILGPFPGLPMGRSGLEIDGGAVGIRDVEMAGTHDVGTSGFMERRLLCYNAVKGCIA